MNIPNPVFCAVDTSDLAGAKALAGTVAGSVGGLKLGLEFFTAHGPGGYREIAASGLPVFLDLKLYDIPNTVAGALRSITRLAPAMTTLHAGGGKAMMRAAVDAADTAAETGVERVKLLGVTVLTSLGGPDLESVGLSPHVPDQVRRLALLAAESGLDGVVCAPHEIEMLRAELGPDFLLVVPGLRPAGTDKGDQQRVMTPREARALGADVLVIGRPITAAPSPAAAAQDIVASLAPAGQDGP